MRRLWLEFEGGPVEGKPVRARLRPPHRGPWLRVQVQDDADLDGSIFLLLRRGHGDLVVGASCRRETLEDARRRLGDTRYEIASVPIVR